MTSRLHHERRAIELECILTRQLCGAGLTSLGRANYADGMGEYYAAFFSLSVGLERFCKLVICFDEQQKKGKFPNNRELISFGHNLVKLRDEVRKISNNRKLYTRYGDVEDEFSDSILAYLSKFANAGLGRYANFSIMTNGSRDDVFEPIHEWQQTVREKILDCHFRGTRAEKAARGRAQIMEQLGGAHSYVRHTAEDCTPLNSIEEASFHAEENLILQKFGRFYTFKIVRWLSEVFFKLTSSGECEAGGELWFGHHEHFDCFRADDEFALNRKIWPPR